MRNKKKENSPMKNKVVQSIINKKPSKTDPYGSYTGIPIEKGEKPIQDADDL